MKIGSFVRVCAEIRKTKAQHSLGLRFGMSDVTTSS
jgi:hypothetical protein